MKRHLQTFAAALLLCTFAVAQSVAQRGRFAAPGTSTADINAATGWSYVGTTIAVVGTGLRITDSSPNVLRGSSGAYINFAEASGFESTAASGGRWRHVGATYFDGNEGNAARRGTITLSGGTGTATVNASAICVCGTQTANPVRCSVAATTLTCTGTGTDACNYHCL